MPDTRPVRPPPSPAESPAPDDFDETAAERWRAWRLRGRVESARTRAQARVVLGLAGVAGVGAVVASLLWP